MNIKILLRKDKDDYIASVPALRDCQTRGETREEALSGVSDRIHRYFEEKFNETENTGDGEIIELSI